MNGFLQFWDGIGQHIVRHAEAYGTGTIALSLSVAKNIPEMIPKSAQEWWTWMRNSVQTALPISRANPTPAAPAPK